MTEILVNFKSNQNTTQNLQNDQSAPQSFKIIKLPFTFEMTKIALKYLEGLET